MYLQDDDIYGLGMKEKEILKVWKQRRGFKGTYRLLIESCLKDEDNSQLAKQWCEEVKKCTCKT